MKNVSNPFFKFVRFFLAALLCWQWSVADASAQAQPSLITTPVIGLTPAYHPAVLRGMTVDPVDPFTFDFLLDAGDDPRDEESLRQSSSELIKYFLASFSIPEEHMWVNLSPYEPDRIIPKDFGQTQMGQELLALDYLLKQLSSSLMNPDSETGRVFWDKIYQRAMEEYGATDIPMNTFNKIWIVPDKASVSVTGQTVYVSGARLKVMLEEDYVALQKTIGAKDFGLEGRTEDNKFVVSGVTLDVVRNILIPAVEQEVNEGRTFAKLRQIYSSMILASWYKQNLKESFLTRLFADSGVTGGVQAEDPRQHEAVYQQYVEAFRKGAFDLIREDYDPASQQVVPRKYFSGGLDMAMKVETEDDASLVVEDLFSVKAEVVDKAMMWSMEELQRMFEQQQREYENKMESGTDFKAAALEKFLEEKGFNPRDFDVNANNKFEEVSAHFYGLGDKNTQKFEEALREYEQSQGNQTSSRPLKIRSTDENRDIENPRKSWRLFGWFTKDDAMMAKEQKSLLIRILTLGLYDIFAATREKQVNDLVENPTPEPGFGNTIRWNNVFRAAAVVLAVLAVWWITGKGLLSEAPGEREVIVADQPDADHPLSGVVPGPPDSLISYGYFIENMRSMRQIVEGQLSDRSYVYYALKLGSGETPFHFRDLNYVPQYQKLLDDLAQTGFDLGPGDEVLLVGPENEVDGQVDFREIRAFLDVFPDVGTIHIATIGRIPHDERDAKNLNRQYARALRDLEDFLRSHSLQTKIVFNDANVLLLPFEDGRFKFVGMNEVVIPQSFEGSLVSDAYGQIRRVLKKGGVLLASFTEQFHPESFGFDFQEGSSYGGIFKPQKKVPVVSERRFREKAVQVIMTYLGGARDLRGDRGEWLIDNYTHLRYTDDELLDVIRDVRSGSDVDVVFEKFYELSWAVNDRAMMQKEPEYKDPYQGKLEDAGRGAKINSLFGGNTVDGYQTEADMQQSSDRIWDAAYRFAQREFLTIIGIATAASFSVYYSLSLTTAAAFVFGVLVLRALGKGPMVLFLALAGIWAFFLAPRRDVSPFYRPENYIAAADSENPDGSPYILPDTLKTLVPFVEKLNAKKNVDYSPEQVLGFFRPYAGLPDKELKKLIAGSYDFVSREAGLNFEFTPQERAALESGIEKIQASGSRDVFISILGPGHLGDDVVDDSEFKNFELFAILEMFDARYASGEAVPDLRIDLQEVSMKRLVRLPEKVDRLIEKYFELHPQSVLNKEKIHIEISFANLQMKRLWPTILGSARERLIVMRRTYIAVRGSNPFGEDGLSEFFQRMKKATLIGAVVINERIVDLPGQEMERIMTSVDPGAGRMIERIFDQAMMGPDSDALGDKTTGGINLNSRLLNLETSGGSLRMAVPVGDPSVIKQKISAFQPVIKSIVPFRQVH